MQILLDAGANAALQDSHGMTPLFCAAKSNLHSCEVVNLLISHCESERNGNYKRKLINMRYCNILLTKNCNVSNYQIIGPVMVPLLSCWHPNQDVYLV